MCGIVGIYGSSDVAVDLYESLLMLQHRGQDAAGIVTYNGHYHLKKDNGLVSEVFDDESIKHLSGNLGLGQVRYRTAGNLDPTAAQPFLINSPYGIALIHNGNLTNYHELGAKIVKQYKRYLNSTSDSEMILNLLGHELQQFAETEMLSPKQIFQAVKRVFSQLKGSYSIIALIAGHGLLAFRDPHGIRPLVLGQRKSLDGKSSEYIVASESAAFDSGGFEVVGDIAAGEVLFIDTKHQVHREVCAEEVKHNPCIFEYVYLARPDSVIDHISVYKARLRMGECLGKKIRELGLEVDVVIPVPDTARTCALTLAHELDVKYREGLIKNRYVGRTFIMPGQEQRQKSIKRKLNPIKLEINKKRVLLVDDSIVRGNTARKIIEMVREQGAEKVYLASCAPPIRHQCVYGVDMPSRKEFVAHEADYDQIAKTINADAVIYQNLEDLVQSVTPPKTTEQMGYCTACFSGKYPTAEVTAKFLEAVDTNHSDSEKIHPA